MLAAAISMEGDVSLRQDLDRARHDGGFERRIGAASCRARCCAHPAQPASQASPAADILKPEQQLEALIAPIALYPGELLANVLAASTYPLEVVQADRRLKERKKAQFGSITTTSTKLSRAAWFV